MSKKLEFDEWEISLETVSLVKNVTGFEDVIVVRVEGPEVEDLKQLSKSIDFAVHGQPLFSIENLGIRVSRLLLRILWVALHNHLCFPQTLAESCVVVTAFLLTFSLPRTGALNVITENGRDSLFEAAKITL